MHDRLLRERHGDLQHDFCWLCQPHFGLALVLPYGGGVKGCTLSSSKGHSSPICFRHAMGIGVKIGG
jgi:hypothetical protein